MRLPYARPVAAARTRAANLGHRLPSGRFQRLGLSWVASCLDCGAPIHSLAFPATAYGAALSGPAAKVTCYRATSR